MTRPSTPLLRSVGLIALLTAASALADESPARVKFAQAQSAYDVGEFEKAARLYQDAYELEPLPAFLFDIAQCHRQLGQYGKAAFFYRRFATRVPELDGPERLQKLIAEMERKEADRVARLKAGSPAAAPVLLPAVAAAGTLGPVLVVREGEPSVPLYQRWWVWAGAGAITVSAVAAAVAVGIASRPQRDPPRYGKLDAR